ncbi:hypothetical protein K458DRAFT_57719 [Lentithecium fluviatile CBS 122367]|uniref:Uncharacterized protein n=1 Tax=Lentithecium fluviatile CBS 122367 TaxID=1168545 RepID=A0A6G1IVU0_9PLEO|nr:hypothetical protein K458DRAFT_57719 [Lentithecium fluviatile CBS 122367]
MNGASHAIFQTRRVCVCAVVLVGFRRSYDLAVAFGRVLFISRFCRFLPLSRVLSVCLRFFHHFDSDVLISTLPLEIHRIWAAGCHRTPSSHHIHNRHTQYPTHT